MGKALESRWMTSAAVLAVLLAVCYWPAATGGSIPGETGDTRFNIYILEHIYQWLIGATSSLASPPMFYPYPGALYFSDVHAGDAWIYAALRFLGRSDYGAFLGWHVVGYGLTYAAAAYSLGRMGARPWSAAAAAALFAFGLPSLAQFGHPQLVYRCGVPLAMLCLWRGLRDRSVGALLWAAVWLFVQTLISVYLGVFLFLLMGLFGLSLLFGAWRADPKLSLKGEIARFRASLRASDVLSTAAFLAMGAACAAVLARHAAISKAYGIVRSWAEIAPMVPRPGSYLIMDGLPLWGAVSRALAAFVPADALHEHNLFLGVGALSLVAVGLVALVVDRRELASRTPLAPMTLAVALLIAATTAIGGVTLYRLVALAPGFGAIRAVTRIILIMMFPLSLLAAFGMEFLARRSSGRLIGQTLLGCLLSLSLYETFSYRALWVARASLEQRIAPIVEAAKARRGDVADPILAYTGPASAFGEYLYLNIDGIMAAQRLGWPSINGYSGHLPPAAGPPDCIRGEEQYVAYRKWAGLPVNLVDTFAFLKRVVHVGLMDCREAGSAATVAVDVQVPLDGVALQPSTAAGTRLRISRVERVGDQISITVAIRNGDSRWLFRDSSGPVRLSWRFLPVSAAEGSSSFAAEWRNRRDIVGDIPPSGEQINVIGAKLPLESGGYHLEVSLVADGLFWFHDRGMEIARYPQIITVP